MLKIEHTEVVGWRAAIRGMRNPKNSWERSDSFIPCYQKTKCHECADNQKCAYYFEDVGLPYKKDDFIGTNDLDLMTRLRNAGTDHRKFMRMIVVYLDITAPLYWVSEHDTYKVGTVRNSCSFMHKGLSKPFDISDFSYNDKNKVIIEQSIIPELNRLRSEYMETQDPYIFEAIRQILPSGYNIRYTWMANYEVLHNIYHARKNHRLQEWRDFCKFIETLPYSELITN